MPFNSVIDLASLTTNGNGFSVDGTNVGDNVGYSIGSSDINGDGLADLLLGASRANSDRGQGHVVFGSRIPFPASLALSSLNGA